MDTTQTTTHIGLCAGYGGIELGLKRVIPDLRTVALCEIEAFACANLVAKMEAGLMDPAPIWSDLKTFPWAEFRGKVDILTGGYPCQPFSAAGKREGKDDPRHLWPWIADGIRSMQPGCCFFENVEGHITLGLSTVISDLEEMGYRTTWGIFSASEVGAPHQRKRVFILAHDDRQRGAQYSLPFAIQTQLSSAHSKGNGGNVWPSRPGEPQHAWEPPRVVGNAKLQGLEGRTIGGDDHTEELTKGCAGMGNAASDGRQHDQQSKNGREARTTAESGKDLGNAADARWINCHSQNHGTQESGKGLVDHREICLSEAQPSLGLHSNESSGFLGQALTLNPYGDSVYAYENISKKIRAREVLFSVWREAISKEIQWTAGGLQCFLAEKILQSGMQLDSFTQRICYFVWCIQTSHEAQGWGLHGMWVYENCRNSSRGQKPVEQFKRELGYAMCQLSYEIALEGRKDAVEAESILQGVREASERAWALSQALPEMEEVWRSSLDQKVWEKGCYIEAASIGNRTDELRLLGNGVVPATAEKAFRVLMQKMHE